MKKILAVAIVVAFTMMLSVNTFAATVTTTDTYYCSGINHTNGVCTGHASGIHHNGNYRNNMNNGNFTYYGGNCGGNRVGNGGGHRGNHH